MATTRKKYTIFVEFGSMGYDDVIYAENIIEARRKAIAKSYKALKNRFPSEIYFQKEGSREPFGHIWINRLVYASQKPAELEFYWYRDYVDGGSIGSHLDYKTGRTRSM